MKESNWLASLGSDLSLISKASHVEVHTGETVRRTATKRKIDGAGLEDDAPPCGIRQVIVTKVKIGKKERHGVRRARYRLSPKRANEDQDLLLHLELIVMFLVEGYIGQIRKESEIVSDERVSVNATRNKNEDLRAIASVIRSTIGTRTGNETETTDTEIGIDAIETEVGTEIEIGIGIETGTVEVVAHDAEMIVTESGGTIVGTIEEMIGGTTGEMIEEKIEETRGETIGGTKEEMTEETTEETTAASAIETETETGTVIATMSVKETGETEETEILTDMFHGERFATIGIALSIRARF